jgi:alpha-glucosidase
LHDFLEEQPDLNWRNPEVVASMLDVLRFWLDAGVDGFRIDALGHLLKDERFRDDPPDPSARRLADAAPLPAFSKNQFGVRELVDQFRKVAEPYGAILIGEVYEPIEELVDFYSHSQMHEAVAFPFNFHLITSKWNPRAITSLMSRYEAILPQWAWPNWVLGNHDRPRVASRIGAAQARVAAMLLLTARGTPTLYYGDELGMRDVAMEMAARRDPVERIEGATSPGRDAERSPMLWSPGEGAGFTTGSPWLPIDPDYRARCVEAEREDAQSMLRLYKSLIDLRRSEPALFAGLFVPVPTSGDPVVAYERTDGASRFLVVLNLTAKPARFCASRGRFAGRVLVRTGSSSGPDRLGSEFVLQGDEGVVIRLDGG